MTTSNVHHFTDGKTHGPVEVVIDDDGRLAMVCSVDGKTWELKTKLTPIAGQPEWIEKEGRSTRKAAARPTIKDELDSDVKVGRFSGADQQKRALDRVERMFKPT